MEFDPRGVQERLQRLWREPRQWGMERNHNFVYLNQIIPDRVLLTRSYQKINDDLQLAPEPYGADFSLPSVITTLAHTICVDRACQGQSVDDYMRIMATRYGTREATGHMKIEPNAPLGGGSEDGGVLAHVTAAHADDNQIRRRLYGGNTASYKLHLFDIQTHVGRVDNKTVTFGQVQESLHREARPACGAVVGMLAHFKQDQPAHRRLRRDLGERNYAFLTENEVLSDEQMNITPVVASAIIAVQTMRNIMECLPSEMDERGVAHLTASLIVNRAARDDPVIYLARGTVFNNEKTIQGFATDAQHYQGKLVPHKGDHRLSLRYGKWELENFPVERL